LKPSPVHASTASLYSSESPSAQQNEFEWQGDLRAGEHLTIRGISGDIDARLAPGREARVIATREGRERNFDDVRIVMFRDGDGVVVCAVYGVPRRPDSCDSDDDRDRGHNEFDVSVHFQIRVPEGVALEASTVSGDVEATGLRSDVEGSTVSGDVPLTTTGVARAHTVSGDLEVAMGSLAWGRLSFRTVSGDIDVTVPAGLEAVVDFDSLSGEFRTDFDLTVTHRDDGFVGSEIEGRIGDGSRRLSFDSVSGDVTLRRSTPGR